MTASRIVLIAVAFMLVLMSAYFITDVVLVASATLIGTLLMVAPAFVRTNRPNHRLIVRDRFGQVVAWPDGRMVLVVPLLQTATESFDLGWRLVLVQDAEFVTLEGLAVRVSAHIAFTVDPQQMQDHLRQMILDQFGNDDARWREHVERLTRAGLNHLLLQRTYAELMSPHGQAAIQHHLATWIAGRVGEMGVSVRQVMILRVNPSEQLAGIIGDVVRRQATTHYIENQVLPLLPALLPYTRRPLEGLAWIGMLDAISNRDLNHLALNFWSPLDGGENGRRQAQPAPRGGAYFPTAAPSRRR